MSISLVAAANSKQKKSSWRGLKSAGRRLQTAVAKMDMLERRRMLSGAPFSERLGPATIADERSSYASVIADVNGDGIPDLVVANSNGTVTIFDGIGKNGRGTGYFKYDQTIYDGLGNGPVFPGDLVVATLENGHPDIIVASPFGSGGEGEVGDISILFGDGKGGFRHQEDGDGQYFLYQGSTAASGGEGADAEIFSIAVADVNDDGIKDIITAGEGGQVNVLIGYTTPYSYFSSPHTYHVGSTNDLISQVAVGDVNGATSEINGDGLPDLVYLNYSTGTVGVLLHNQTFDSVDPGNLQPFDSESGESVNDGPYNKNVISFALGYNSYFSLPELVTVEAEKTGHNQISVLFGDYNANIVKGIKSETVFGAYQEFSVTSAGEGFAYPVFGDINGDGAQDLLIVQQGNDDGYSTFYVTAFYGNTDNGYFNQPSTFSKTFDGSGGGYSTQAIAFGDVNGDGQTDAVVTYYSNNSGGSGGGDSGNNDNYTFLSDVEQPPEITSADNTTFEYEKLGSFTVTTTGYGTPSIFVVDGDLPEGVTLTDDGNGAATLTGIPQQYGQFFFLIEAENGNSPDAFQDFALDVDKAPTFGDGFEETGFTPGTYKDFTIGYNDNNVFNDDVVRPADDGDDNDVFFPGFPYSGSEGQTGETLSIENGELPPGLQFEDNGNGTARIFGTPDQTDGGIYELTLIGNNNVSPAAVQTLDIDVAPVFNSAPSVQFAIGVHSSFTVSTTASDAYLYTETTLPAGITFTNNGNGTGTLSGTPTAGDKGSHGIVFNAENFATENNSGDDDAPVQQSFDLIINTAKPPVITSANKASFWVGTPGVFIFNTTGFPTGTLTLSGADLPPSVTFTDNGNGTGTLYGIPAAGTAGVYSLFLTDHNGSPKDAVQAFTLTINQKLVITSAATSTFTVGTHKTFDVTTSGFPVASLSASGLPSGLKFTDDGDGDGTISGTPGPNDGGTYKVTITAHNGNGTVTQTFSLVVDQAPALKGLTSAPTVNLTKFKPFSTSYNLSGAGTPLTLSDIDYDGVGGISLSLTNNGTQLLLSGTPEESGNYTLTFHLTNADDTLTSDLSIKLKIAT